MPVAGWVPSRMLGHSLGFVMASESMVTGQSPVVAAVPWSGCHPLRGWALGWSLGSWAKWWWSCCSLTWVHAWPSAISRKRHQCVHLSSVYWWVCSLGVNFMESIKSACGNTGFSDIEGMPTQWQVYYCQRGVHRGQVIFTECQGRQSLFRYTRPYRCLQNIKNTKSMLLGGESGERED